MLGPRNGCPGYFDECCKITLHPGYNSKWLINDIALMSALSVFRIKRPFFLEHKSTLLLAGEKLLIQATVNKDTCKGDRGSPFVCQVDGKADKYQQVGIVSWGLVCGRTYCPGTYVNVALFTQWIDKQMVNHNLDSQIYKH
ncbi:Trypsin domain containing protein [Asbolus verrucosus]|uniref:Trypsin domain containing protein n=1 Tax=Asbolus verrucosus TaxID=1661398 RepID=A0A482VZL2_ASBVE|nr:Trypsin domain containing protein [Asbolus verrucosus]